MSKLSLVANGPDGIAIDVGANLGLYSELLSPLFSRVIAVEPQPKLAAYLKRVAPKNVEVVEAIASANPGVAKLKTPRMAPGRSKFFQLDALATVESWLDDVAAIDIIDVKAVTIDELSRTLPRLDFLKIDVEGHELMVIEGAQHAISKFRPLFLIEVEKRCNPQAIEVFQRLEALGYLPFYLEPPLRSNFQPATANDLAKLQDAAATNLHTRGVSPDKTGYVNNFVFVHRDDHRVAAFSPS
jgi:FkbM family methyltransferase